MRGRSIALILLVAFAGGAAACSDDGGGADAQPFIDALTEELLADDEGGFVLSEEQAECIAEGTIDAIGADFLVDNDVTPEDVADSDGPQDLDLDLSEEQARGAAEAFVVDCDLELGTAFLGLDASDEAVECVNENLDTDALVDAQTEQYLGNEDASEEQFDEVFTSLQAACGEFLGG